MPLRQPTLLAALAVTISLALAPARGLAAAASAPGAAAAPAAAATASLYDRLGGVYAIAAVVDAFIERLLVNETLNANPAIDAARRRVPKQGLKFQVTALVCQATGGPCNYIGRDMRTAHAHLGITEEQWQAMLADFVATLEGFSVPAAEQAELVALVEGTKPEIVPGVAAAPRP